MHLISPSQSGLTWLGASVVPSGLPPYKRQTEEQNPSASVWGTHSLWQWPAGRAETDAPLAPLYCAGHPQGMAHNCIWNVRGETRGSRGPPSQGEHTGMHHRTLPRRVQRWSQPSFRSLQLRGPLSF